MKIPEGWKLVPVEPTAEMLCEAELAYNGSHRDAYRAMLAVAPTPPAQENEPVAYMDVHDNWDLYKNKPEQIDVIPLYTRPDNSELRKAAEEALHWLEYMNISSVHNHTQAERARHAENNLRAALEGKP